MKILGNDARRKSGLLGGVIMVALISGLVGTTRFADAQPAGTDLSDLIESKLAPTPADDAVAASPASSAPDDAIGTAARMALGGLGLAAAIFVAALFAKRARERRMGEVLGSNLAVKESVWVGRGQKILLVTFENHKVLVGVSGGALHNLGVFGEEAEAAASTVNPIEREAAKRTAAEKRSTSEFAEFVKGELAGTIQETVGAGKDPRQKMLYELNSL